MVAHVETDCRARDRNGGVNVNAGRGICVSRCFHKTIEAQVSFVPCCCPADVIPGIQGRKYKRSRLAFLPCQVFPESEIQCGTKDREWTPIMALREQFTHRYA